MDSRFNVPSWCEPFQELLNTAYTAFWRPPKSDNFINDKKDWDSLYIGIKKRIKWVLRGFTNMEVEVIDDVGFLKKLMAESFSLNKNVPLKDLSLFFMLLTFQESMEGIHTQSYALADQILTLPVEDGTYVDDLVDLISSMRFDNEDDEFKVSRAIVRMIFNEGIIFNTRFSLFSFLKKKGLITETCTINSYVCRDEWSHVETFVNAYNIFSALGLIPRLPEEELYSILREYVEIDARSADILLGNLDNEERSFFLQFTAENSKLYTKFIADRIISAIGYTPLYGVDNHVYDFTEQCKLKPLKGFFDVKVDEYDLVVDNEYEDESDPE